MILIVIFAPNKESQGCDYISKEVYIFCLIEKYTGYKGII